MPAYNLKRPDMIVSRTPLRISFAGGGTDLSDFFTQDYGAVLSTAIDQYIYVTVKRHGTLFAEKYRLNYSETETVQNLEDIENEIIREALRMVPVEPPLYISTVADLPASSGLGSSSCFAVGLLNALHAMRGESVTPAQLAEEAYQLEHGNLKRPVGKQDQYAAAFGGLNYFRFESDGRVTLEPLTLSNQGVVGLFEHLILFWTNITRNASTVLSKQKENTVKNTQNLIQMREHSLLLKGMMFEKFDPLEIGKVLDDSWQLKKRLASNISNLQIDQWYERAKAAGALGGKICGAGGGGFLCMVVHPEHRARVKEALSELVEVPIAYEPQGSRVLFEE